VPGIATAPVYYQWQFGGTNIPGATGTSCLLANVQINDSGYYSIVASNAAGVSAQTEHLAVGYFTNGPVLWFNFDQDCSGGRVVDVSGNGNDGWQMNPTNWITSTTGVFSNDAAQFTYVGFISNDVDHVYPVSQYIAVTNLNGFAFLTNGTISIWAQFDTNNDTAMRLLDNGQTVQYAANQTLAVNSWALCRDFYYTLELLVYPDQNNNGGNRYPVAWWPVDVDVYSLASKKFHLYTATIDCPGNTVIAYYDGQPYVTNTIDLPWIRVYGCASQPWLSIGAMSHDGTPQWGDDAYPNSGFFAGKMDDVRIYNRTLSATEVEGIYTGSPVQVRPPHPNGLHITVAGP
jgi:hypothetical protein